jgi:hypothetical protein
MGTSDVAVTFSAARRVFGRERCSAAPRLPAGRRALVPPPAWPRAATRGAPGMATGGWSASGLPPAGPVSKPKASLRVGQRVRKLGTAAQLGSIRFVGELDGRPGVWVGVEWDEIGAGDTNGELNGRRYFTCSLRGQRVGNAASFVRESELFVGGAHSAARALLFCAPRLRRV